MFQPLIFRGVSFFETGSWINQGTIASPRDADACRLVKLASLAYVVCPEAPRKNPEMVKEVLLFEGILVDFWWILINMYLQNLNMMPIPTCKKGPTQPHPKRWFSRGNPVISGKSRLVKYYDLARTVILSWYIMVYVSFRKCKGLQPHERLVKMSFLLFRWVFWVLASQIPVRRCIVFGGDLQEILRLGKRVEIFFCHDHSTAVFK